MKKSLKLILISIVRVAQKVSFSFIDIYESVLGIADPKLPPKRLRFVGDGDFKRTGDEFLKYFIELGGLRKNDRVLDVGCGIGRMAIPLTKYLSAEGRYEGFDIVANGIAWCKEKIQPEYPNFQFQLADILNTSYNAEGRSKASDYKFPYKDESFDLVFLTSVFTHMLPNDVANYLSEISRVLKPGGKCLITYFLLNPESIDHIDKRESKWPLKYHYDDYYLDDKDMPESVVAYKESFVRTLHEKHGLKIAEPIHFGSWAGRKNFLSFQDIVIAKKQIRPS